MQETYQVQGEKESLVAKLVENGERSVELTYRNAEGDSQVGTYRDGFEVSTRATLSSGNFPIKDRKGSSFLVGYLAAYDRLGPELRAQIPPDWHAVLGRWLAPKE